MELLLTRKENKILSILADERRLLQIHAENMEEDPRTAVVGDIYVGKVRNVVKISMRHLWNLPKVRWDIFLWGRRCRRFIQPGAERMTDGFSLGMRSLSR